MRKKQAALVVIALFAAPALAQQPTLAAGAPDPSAPDTIELHGATIVVPEYPRFPKVEETPPVRTEAEELVQMHKDAGDHFDREDQVSGKLVPMPYLDVGPSLMGGGYSVWAYHVAGGVNLEGTHWIFRSLAEYDDGRKRDDNDQPNPKGHDRSLNGALYFRPARAGWTRDLYFGAGYRWSQLSTTNYTKGSNRYQVGCGYDWFMRTCESCRRDYSMRINVDWVTAGNDWQNGSHGPDVNLIWPSPRERRHFFWKEEIAVYRFHTTVTESNNAYLTRQQLASKSFDSFAEFGIMYRF
jgi:hypothetical protein